jgi:hypothetical protein
MSMSFGYGPAGDRQEMIFLMPVVTASLHAPFQAVANRRIAVIRF